MHIYMRYEKNKILFIREDYDKSYVHDTQQKRKNYFNTSYIIRIKFILIAS